MCWPGKGNRDPEPVEVENCKDRLLKTVYIADPKIIISVGAFAAKTLMNKRSFSITKERGRIHDVTIAGTHIGVKYPVMSILHPSYLMRNPDFENSEGIWTATKKDLKKVFQLLTELEKCS
jgi:DNA polymerase